MAPWTSITRRSSAWYATVSRTSHAPYHGRGCPAATASPISASPPSSRVPQKATRAPWTAKARTSSAPMPELPPEMNTTLSRREG